MAEKRRKVQEQAGSEIRPGVGMSAGDLKRAVSHENLAPAAERKAGAERRRAQGNPGTRLVRVDVVGCAACGKTHTAMLFQRRPDGVGMREWPYAAMCTETRKTVFMRYTGEDDPETGKALAAFTAEE